MNNAVCTDPPMEPLEEIGQQDLRKVRGRPSAELVEELTVIFVLSDHGYGLRQRRHGVRCHALQQRFGVRTPDGGGDRRDGVVHLGPNLRTHRDVLAPPRSRVRQRVDKGSGELPRRHARQLADESHVVGTRDDAEDLVPRIHSLRLLDHDRHERGGERRDDGRHDASAVWGRHEREHEIDRRRRVARLAADQRRFEIAEDLQQLLRAVSSGQPNRERQQIRTPRCPNDDALDEILQDVVTLQRCLVATTDGHSFEEGHHQGTGCRSEFWRRHQFRRSTDASRNALRVGFEVGLDVRDQCARNLGESRHGVHGVESCSDGSPQLRREFVDALLLVQSVQPESCHRKGDGQTP